MQNLRNLYYVDDDYDDLHFFKEAVEQIGAEVSLFRLSDDLLEALIQSQNEPSLVFLDLNMPFKNGFELLESIKQNADLQDIPLIIYSTANDSHTVELCRKLGAALYIRKPTSIAMLKQILRQVLAIDWENYKTDIKNFVI